MMILRSSPPSPFGRKVKIAASVIGLSDRIEVQASDTNDPNVTLRTQNPLGKIPILILEDGSPLYDSRVICEYLDGLHDGVKLFPEGASRWPALRLAAIGDGLMDASILLVYEQRFRPEEIRHKPWMDYQAEKVARTLAFLESAPPQLSDAPNIGDITLACALGYRDLRFEGSWRASHPHLVAWLDAFAAKVPAFEKTRITA